MTKSFTRVVVALCQSGMSGRKTSSWPAVSSTLTSKGTGEPSRGSSSVCSGAALRVLLEDAELERLRPTFPGLALRHATGHVEAGLRRDEDQSADARSLGLAVRGAEFHPDGVVLQFRLGLAAKGILQRQPPAIASGR